MRVYILYYKIEFVFNKYSIVHTTHKQPNSFNPNIMSTSQSTHHMTLRSKNNTESQHPTSKPNLPTTFQTKAQKDPSSDPLYTEMDIPDAPEGWNDPIEWTFIGRFVRDTNNNKFFFNDFEEAVVAANDIDECRGITLTKYGYSLRKGKVYSDPTLIGRASWTKKIVFP